MFDKSFYRTNRERLRNILEDDQIAIVAAHRQVERSRDTEHEFIQERNFYYLTGDSASQQMYVVLTKNEELLVGIDPNKLDIQWHGAKTVEQVAEQAGIDAYIVAKSPIISGFKKITDFKNKTVLVIESRLNSTMAVVANPCRQELLEGLDEAGIPNTKIKSLNEKMAALRSIKSEEEIAVIDGLCRTTIEALESLGDRVFEKGLTETQLASELLYRFTQSGANGHGFLPIVARGGNAATIHHRAGSTVQDTQRSILFDVGASDGQYSADISRTLLHPELATDFDRSILEDLKQIQKELIQMVKPGASMVEIEAHTVKLLGKVLKRKACIKDASDEKHIREFYGHGVSHSLGLDVHDIFDYRKPLEAGMIITIEPGLYFPDKEIGFRVEDCILVTDKGSRILGV